MSLLSNMETAEAKVNSSLPPSFFHVLSLLVVVLLQQWAVKVH